MPATLPRAVLIPLLAGLSALLFAYLSWRIDFHPDEAIYFDGIPTSLRNDTGAFFNAWYGLLTHLQPTPQGARLASALLGGATFAALAILFGARGLHRTWHVAALWVIFTLSYQSIFVFVRVRPEAAWWFCAAWLLAALVSSERRSRGRMLAALLVPALLLPMNHRLCWFVCAYFVLYAVLFLHRRKDWPRFFVLCGGLLLGAMLNMALRALWLGVPVLAALHDSLDSPAAAPQAFGTFAELVFKGSPDFLNDSAQYPNLYEAVAGHTGYWLSHAFVQTQFWLMMVPLPFMGRGWRERFLFAFPLFAFLAFWRSGYYNPTYAPGFSLVCALMLLYLAGSARGWRRWVATPILALSLINGLSFLTTRLLDHGEASYFRTERAVHAFLIQQGPGKKVAVPERMSPVLLGLDATRFVDFKDAVPPDADILIIDNYDWAMYAFVPDFEARKRELHQLTDTMCLQETYDRPVYKRDRLYDTLAGDVAATRGGSWFFRNSVQSSIRVYTKCHQ